ncbi:hypothetical protein [Secundilactobacillus kimchicus]|uniref:hypothetical protein n=1 Tax=Secundilactobacillus kimchicus TaxID=528209 RepID=UPI0024A7B03B|nr:hypothetical protein [Secundilactobacillus kimchicus]
MTSKIQSAHPTDAAFEHQPALLITPQEAREYYKRGQITSRFRFVCGRPNVNQVGTCQVPITCKPIDSKPGPSFILHHTGDDNRHTCDIQPEVQQIERQGVDNAPRTQDNGVDGFFVDFGNQPTAQTVNPASANVKLNGEAGTIRTNRGNKHQGNTTQHRTHRRNLSLLGDVVDLFWKDPRMSVAMRDKIRQFVISELFIPLFKIKDPDPKRPYPGADFIYYSHKAKLTDYGDPAEHLYEIKIGHFIAATHQDFSVIIREDQLNQIFAEKSGYLNSDRTFSIFCTKLHYEETDAQILIRVDEVLEKKPNSV